MQIETRYQIEKATSDDTSRSNLADPVLEDDRLVATNGHALATVPVTREEADTDGAVPCAALKAARIIGKRTGLATLTVNGTVALLDGSTMPRPDHGRFPDWHAVVPAEAPVFSIGLDARLLLALAQAIGADERGTARVRLDFVPEPPKDDEQTAADAIRPSADRPIRVRRVVDPANEPTAPWGLLMPVRVT